MKLLIEYVDPSSIEILKEDKEEGGEKKKEYLLKGPMIGANVRNRNGRIYPKEIIEREVKKFQQMIKEGSGVGTLDHGSEPNIDMDRISHKIISLDMDGDIAYGVAKVGTTPCGKILKCLIDDGIRIGMSTRGIGSLDEGNKVKEDFQLLSVDAVQNPSYDKAVVEAVLENKEWILDGDRYIEKIIDGKTVKQPINCEAVEQAVTNLKKSVDKSYNSRNLSHHTLRCLTEFINIIRNKK